MTTKSNVNAPPNAGTGHAVGGPADFSARWAEARAAYPLYAALAAQFELASPLYPYAELPPARPTREVFDRDLAWFDSLDDKVRAYQIRQLPSEILNASEEALRAFTLRALKKADKTSSDRDKIDLLLVQYFAMCAPEDLYRKEIRLEDVASVLRPLLASADATPLEWCEPLEEILKTLETCHSLRDLMEHGLLEQGRLLKESAGAMFYDPAALVAFCRFNFSLRRAFIRMLHADLSAVRQAIDALEAAGVKSVDCRRAGFSAAETTVQLRHYCENWRQPFHKDYTESSVSHAFEQLLALRADLEEAVGRALGKAPATPPAPAKQSGSPAKPMDPASLRSPNEARVSTDIPPAASVQVAPAVSPVQSKAVPGQVPASAGDSRKPKPAPEPAAPAIPALDADKCMEAIWEQLIAAPPSRGRSMSTVVLRDTKVLLSSWEVTAFVAEGDQEAEDLRRAVVARALLSVAMDERKRSGDQSALASALTLAKSEVSYFQGRVEQAKRAKNTEAAVNLGISTKRLLSAIEEAEKLQP